MRTLRRFVLRRRVRAPEGLGTCVCRPAVRGVPRDDGTCFHCTHPISESLDELRTVYGRPIEVSR